MASTNLKKNAKGYGYNYTNLAEIHNYLEQNGYRYYQYVEPIDGNDYIYTVPIKVDENGEEHALAPRRGCRIVQATLTGKSNPAQENGSAITYARRYSLLMAFGLATDDDDAQCMTNYKAVTDKDVKVLEDLCKRKGLDIATTFPKGIKALKPDDYTEAIRRPWVV